MANCRKYRACGGLTLVELIIVMIIMSLLAASAVVAVSSKNQYAVNTQADQLRRNLSHIQLLATAWGVSLRLTVTSTSYMVTCRSTQAGTPCTTLGATPIDPATGSSFSVTLTDGVTLSWTNGSTVDFDSMGRPISGTALIISNPVRTYTLTGNGRSVTVTLRPLTGFAETS